MTRRCLTRVVPFLVLLCASGADAQSSPYFIALSQTLGHDSNLLRLSTDQATPDGYSRSDTVSTTSLLGGFDQSFGRQRAYANVALRDNRYSENGIFDNRSYSARAGLDWSTIGRLSGSLNGSANRSLQRFNSDEIGFLTEKNLETVKAVNARFSLGVVTEYSLELSGGHTDVRNSLQRDTVQARQFNQNNVTFGLRWRPSSATALGLGLGATRGEYPKFRTAATGLFESDRFERNDVELTGSYRVTGASSFEGRLNSGKTTYEINDQRDFSGVTGSVAWIWQTTGKLRLITSYTRDTGQESYATAAINQQAVLDYSRVNSNLRLQADFELSAKVSLAASLSRYDRTVVRTIDDPSQPPNASGRDSTLGLALSARWSPVRYLQLGCDYSRERRRSSGQLVSDLNGSGFSCSGQITLQ